MTEQKKERMEVKPRLLFSVLLGGIATVVWAVGIAFFIVVHDDMLVRHFGVGADIEHYAPVRWLYFALGLFIEPVLNMRFLPDRAGAVIVLLAYCLVVGFIVAVAVDACVRRKKTALLYFVWGVIAVAFQFAFIDRVVSGSRDEAVVALIVLLFPSCALVVSTVFELFRKVAGPERFGIMTAKVMGSVMVVVMIFAHCVPVIRRYLF